MPGVSEPPMTRDTSPSPFVEGARLFREHAPVLLAAALPGPIVRAVGRVLGLLLAPEPAPEHRLAQLLVALTSLVLLFFVSDVLTTTSVLRASLVLLGARERTPPFATDAGRVLRVHGLVFALGLLGSSAFLLPGLVVLVAYAMRNGLALPIALAEEKGAWSAFASSRALHEGRTAQSLRAHAPVLLLAPFVTIARIVVSPRVAHLFDSALAGRFSLGELNRPYFAYLATDVAIDVVWSAFAGSVLAASYVAFRRPPRVEAGAIARVFE